MKIERIIELGNILWSSMTEEERYDFCLREGTIEFAYRICFMFGEDEVYKRPYKEIEDIVSRMTE